MDNALTLVGVGSATSFDHIEVTNSGNNGPAALGGKPILNNVYALDNRKNQVYAGLGTQMELTGLLAMTRDAAAHQSGGTNGMLIVNNPVTTTATPLTNVKVLNSSFIGPEHCNSGSLSSDFKDGISFDNNGGGDIYNTVITGFKEHALYFNDALSSARTANNTLNFSYNSMTNNGSGDYAYNTIAINPWNGCGTSMADWIGGGTGCRENGNQFNPFVLGYDTSFCGDYCDENYVPNFILTEDSELDLPSSSSIYDTRGTVQFNELFDWVSLCPQDQVYCTPEMRKEAKERKSGLIIVPNPTQSQANLMFNANSLGNATILIFDKVTGRVLFHKKVTIKQVGEQKIPISVKELREGIYPIRVQLKDAVINGMISIQ